MALAIKLESKFNFDKYGAVVRALASQQCGPVSIPGVGVPWGLSLLLGLVLAPRGFFYVDFNFPPLLRNQHC